MKRAAGGLALSLVAAILAFALAEGFVRWMRPGLAIGPTEYSNPFWRHDDRLGWANIPNQSGVFSRDEFTTRVTINSMGFRDVERDPDWKGPGPRPWRIAVLGDSFTWGHGVNDDEVFTRLLEQRLGNVQVWNLGVSGYSTDQELLLYQELGPRIRPDVVLLMVSRNDYASNTTSAQGGYDKPRFVERDGRFELTGVPVPVRGLGEEALAWARRRSAFVNGLWLLGADAGVSPDRPANRQVQARTARYLFDRLREEAVRTGAAFAPVIVPSIAHVYFPQVLEGEAWDDSVLKDWGKERGAPVLDLVPGFREAYRKTGRRYHYRHDKHWNAAGHRLAAELLAGLLADRGLLPARDQAPRPRSGGEATATGRTPAP